MREHHSHLKSVNFLELFSGIEFYRPSVVSLRGVVDKEVINEWVDKGFIAFIRRVMGRSHKSHQQLVTRLCLETLNIKNSSLKNALIEIAQHESEKFVKGESSMKRFGIKHVAYEMIKYPPLF